MTAAQVPEWLIEAYEAAIDTQPDIERKGGAKLPHTSVNGHMYSSLTKDGRMGVRLSDDDRAAFLDEHDTIEFRNYGALIKEHVEVPEALVQQPEELGALLARSRTYAMTLSPKG